MLFAQQAAHNHALTRRPLYQVLAAEIEALRRRDSARRRNRIALLVRRHLSGGKGCTDADILLPESHPDYLVFVTHYKHVDGAGHSRGWAAHYVIASPGLAVPFRLSISGDNRANVKNKIQRRFERALAAKVPDPLP